VILVTAKHFYISVQEPDTEVGASVGCKSLGDAGRSVDATSMSPLRVIGFHFIVTVVIDVSAASAAASGYDDCLTVWEIGNNTRIKRYGDLLFTTVGCC